MPLRARCGEVRHRRGTPTRVNALVVGRTRTEMTDRAVRTLPELRARFEGGTLQKRMTGPAEVAEVAEAALWLCGDRSSFVTGAARPVDGGTTAT
ncbi:SDR family oxidoreductase [Streptomyces sp. NPDC051105]|uniref:SDR family oxidoreductase n=1 Tax=Streptomyces sp. NPDC051105 TaxID=3154843 RepID=UPI0034399461